MQRETKIYKNSGRYEFGDNYELIFKDNYYLYNCNIICGNNCLIECGNYCKITCKDNCLIECGDNCNIICGNNCCIKSSKGNTSIITKNTRYKIRKNIIFEDNVWYYCNHDLDDILINTFEDKDWRKENPDKFKELYPLVTNELDSATLF